ncbi:MAG: septum formation initiator family protein [Ferruginibacter sp.]|nr:septum formation initiator family protein [Ferruginibacter sp.]
MQYIKPILKFIKNKYIIATLAFMVWMLFFDPKDWGTIAARNNKYKELKESEKHLTSLLKDTKKELSLLKTNAASIERYAREKFFMKKDNEDLFIVKIPE